MNRLGIRTWLLLVALWIAIFVVIFFTERSRQELLRSASIAQADTDMLLWRTVHELSDESMVSSAVDYTFWDDMAEFAEGSRDLGWAKENLEPGLSSFAIDALWVYTADGSLRYSIMDAGDGVTTPPPLPLDRTAMERLVIGPSEAYGPIHEFYWFSDVGPMTLVGSDITSTDDPEHAKPSRGYYFIARILTPDHALSTLADLGITAQALPMTTVPEHVLPGSDTPHIFWHRMYDYSGKTIGAIRLERTASSFTALFISSSRYRNIMLGLWLILGIAVSMLVIILGKTRQRADALADEMTKTLRESNTLLEQRVMQRTEELQDDIRQRAETEDRLKKRTDELERLNKVMVDRELRIVELKKKVTEPPPSS